MSRGPGFLAANAKPVLKGAFIALILVLTTSCREPSSDWRGTWKLDPSRSDIPGPTLTVSITPDGMYHNASGGGTLNFGCDGKTYQASKTLTAFCTQKNSSDMEITAFKDGSKFFVAHWELSSDGQELTVRGTSFHTDGSKEQKESRYTRVSGSAGFVGGWRNVNPFEGIPSIWRIDLQGSSLHFSYPERGWYADVLLDGRDAAIRGPRISPGATIALKERNPRELSSETKVKGEVANVGYWRISGDGRSLTESYWSPARPNEKAVLVYEKQ